ncbi:hypothetical protein AB0I53_19405 [Saccharopolyspora sp. NPDC050389]|uniref:hypothetical protein n=1 Tax=Saccharopolyspora sp. NPDC050389 TaxID=3155516 RepID=UPI0033D142AE
MPKYTVTGLRNQTTKAVLISAVFDGRPREVSTRTRSGDWGQWTRFAEVVDAANPTRAEATVNAHFITR